ncbi:taurine dioxygenase [Pseudonocardia ailaonensis]|uniref:Taurine dioxygenase n=1 Tax=Pseudonocardia ailaonensis TaxID=367279 RepID=A0ABN2N9L8_9PSEU
MSATLNCRPIAGHIGAVVEDFDLTQPLGPDTGQAIREAVATHGVIFFREQNLDVEQHVAVAEALGPLRDKTLAAEKAAGRAQVGVISTGNGLAYEAATWHTDSTSEELPPSFCVLHMQQPAAVGGDTMWASQAAAYEALSPSIKDLLDGKTAHHGYSAKHLVFNPHLSLTGIDHPVVVEQPITGRKALFVNKVFTQQINGLSFVESDNLLRLLFEHSVQPQFTCRWSWTKNDVAIWNNPYVQHFAIHDYGTSSRKIHRVEVEGTPMVMAKTSQQGA